MRIVHYLPSSSSLTFLAGLFAGAGINMLTSAAIGESGTSTWTIILDSLAWVAAAGFLTSAARRLDAADREASFYILDPNLSANEKRAVRERQLDKVARTTVVMVGLTGLALVAAVLLLLPGIIG